MPQTASRFLFVISDKVTRSADPMRRSMILAQALADCGGACTVIATPESTLRLATLAPDMTRAPAESDSAEDLCRVAGQLDYDAVIIDHAGLDLEAHETLTGSRPGVILDDQADRRLGGRIIVNPGLEQTAEAYTDLIRESADVLTGPGFALMASEYTRLRDDRVMDDSPVRRVLLSLDEDTPIDLSLRMIDQIRPRLGDAWLEVLLPESFESPKNLSRIAARDPRLILHSHPLERPRIAARADIAISMVGPGLWEACALGLPIIAIAVSPLDRETASGLARRDAVLALDLADKDFDSRLDRALVRLLADPALRRKLGTNAARLTDGTGAGRIAHRLIELLSR